MALIKVVCGWIDSVAYENENEDKGTKEESDEKETKKNK